MQTEMEQKRVSNQSNPGTPRLAVLPIWIAGRMWRPQGLAPRSGPEAARGAWSWDVRPHLEVADNTVRLRLVQPARRGHRELLCSADEKVARGGVAAALRAAIAEFGFLSAHLGSAQGCGKGRRPGTWGGGHK